MNIDEVQKRQEHKCQQKGHLTTQFHHAQLDFSICQQMIWQS